jgi:hypothetical protein
VVCAESLGLDVDDIAGLVVMHTCDNPRCVNPKHLRLGTQALNTADRDAKDRHGSSVVSLQDALQIVKRMENGERGCDIAEELGLARSTVYYQKVRVRRIVSSVAS